VLPVETNIVIFTLDRGLRSDEFLRTLQSQGIKAGSMGDSTIRFVMHLGIGDAQLSVLIDKAASDYNVISGADGDTIEQGMNARSIDFTSRHPSAPAPRGRIPPELRRSVGQ
jgi:hypothetical protein